MRHVVQVMVGLLLVIKLLAIKCVRMVRNRLTVLAIKIILFTIQLLTVVPGRSAEPRDYFK